VPPWLTDEPSYNLRKSPRPHVGAKRVMVPGAGLYNILDYNLLFYPHYKGSYSMAYVPFIKAQC